MLTPQHHPEPGAAPAETFDAGKVIIEHVSNSAIDHPLIHLPKIMGIDFSVTKHVLMLWIVSIVLFTIVTWTVRRYVRQQRLLPTGLMNVLEAVVEFVRDTMVEPAVGRRWVRTWTPLILTLFLFIFTANIVGLIPIFEVLGLLDRFVLHSSPDSFIAKVLHGGTHRDRELQRHRRPGDGHLLARSSSPAPRRTASSSTGSTWRRRVWPGRSTSC